MAFENFNPGELKKTIEILRFIPAGKRNTGGFVDPDAEPETEVVRTCKAKITDESGTKAIDSGSEFSVARRRFFIRSKKTGITTDMYIRYDGKLYAIVRPPNPYGDEGRFTEIWTERKERV